MTQAIEHLPSKCAFLSSKPSTTKKYFLIKKKKGVKGFGEMAQVAECPLSKHKALSSNSYSSCLH
jgi:hypothetical protein